MPEQARILRFPERPTRRASAADALRVASEYLSQDISDRRGVAEETIYRDLDVLLAVCGLLKERSNTNPPDVLAEASRIFEWLTNHAKGIGYFDERDFFLGESALLAASASRHVCDRAETELWLDRADANFRHTINSAPSLARVAYVRLSLRFDTSRFSDVLELIPSVALTFERLGMHAELGKCRFLEAMSLKELGRYAEATACLQRLVSEAQFQTDSPLRGLAMMNLGNIRSHEGDQVAALTAYKGAQSLLEGSQNPPLVANLKTMVADTLRLLGKGAAAVEAYRESVADFLRLGMHSRVAYLRVMLAEALLQDGRAREAEWELLAALPTINDHKLVPEGFAAVALLQQSVKLRKTDPAALAELRKYLQAAN